MDNPLAKPIDDDHARSILAGYPKAISVFESVKEFYGDALSMCEHYDWRDPERNCCGIDAEPEVKAHLALSAIDGRKAAALTHELLHLQLPILGFVIICGNRFHPRDEAVLTVELMKLRNSVEHALIVDRFLESGFGLSEFTRNGIPELSATKLAFENAKRRWAPASIIATFCRINYAQVCLAHLCGLMSKDRANAFLAMAHEFVEGFSMDGEVIEQWVTRGEFRDTSTDFSAFNDLMSIVGWPHVFGCRLHRGAPGPPFAVACAPPQ